MKTYVRSYIRDCSISITNICNLSCPYCFRNSKSSDISNELTLSDWKKIFDKLKQANVLRVLITGGEPFARNDLSQIIKMIFEHKIQISIATNGTIINESVLDLLSKYRMAVNYVQVSLDGNQPQNNDLTRGLGSFEKSINMIKLLKSIDVHVSCRITLQKNNYKEFRQIYEYIHNELKVADITVNEVQPVGRGKENSELNLTEQERIEFIKNNEDIILKINFMDCEISRLIRLLYPYINQNVIGGKLRTCTRAYKGFHILQDGFIVPCDTMSELKLANILTIDDISDFWENNEILKKLRERNEINLLNFNKCRKCEYINICTGSCPVSDYEISKRLCSNEDDKCFKFLYHKYKELIR